MGDPGNKPAPKPKVVKPPVDVKEEMDAERLRRLTGKNQAIESSLLSGSSPQGISKTLG